MLAWIFQKDHGLFVGKKNELFVLYYFYIQSLFSFFFTKEDFTNESCESSSKTIPNCRKYCICIYISIYKREFIYKIRRKHSYISFEHRTRIRILRRIYSAFVTYDISGIARKRSKIIRIMCNTQLDDKDVAIIAYIIRVNISFFLFR